MAEVDLGRGSGYSHLPEVSRRTATPDGFRSQIQTPLSIQNRDLDGLLEGVVEQALRKKLGEHDKELNKLHQKRERLSEDMQRHTEKLRELVNMNIGGETLTRKGGSESSSVDSGSGHLPGPGVD